MEIPNLSGFADPQNVSKKGTGSFKASYINWARTLNDIRENAPGWMPEMVENIHGEQIHTAPDGSGYLMIRFQHVDGTKTPAIPHAIMDHKMNSIGKDRASGRDVSDSFVRGACKAAAALFGYAWEMWSKDDPMVRKEEPEAESANAGEYVWPGKKKHTGKTLDEIMLEDPEYLPSVLKENHEMLKKTSADLLKCVELVVLAHQDNGKQDFPDAKT